VAIVAPEEYITAGAVLIIGCYAFQTSSCFGFINISV
jgi:hypothetical protein